MIDCKGGKNGKKFQSNLLPTGTGEYYVIRTFSDDELNAGISSGYDSNVIKTVHVSLLVPFRSQEDNSLETEDLEGNSAADYSVRHTVIVESVCNNSEEIINDDGFNSPCARKQSREDDTEFEAI